MMAREIHVIGSLNLMSAVYAFLYKTIFMIIFRAFFLCK